LFFTLINRSKRTVAFQEILAQAFPVYKTFGLP